MCKGILKGIILQAGFYENSKVKNMEVVLGFEGVRSLQILWLWCARKSQDSEFAALPHDIEYIADWRGKKGEFLEACLGEWIEKTETGYRLTGIGEIFDFCTINNTGC